MNDRPVGINIISPLPSGTLKSAFRESRIVVLPDFQGMGLGYEMSVFTGAIYRSIGKRYFTKTVHPALGKKRNKSKDWRPTPDNGKIRKKRKKESNYASHWKDNLRISYCHEYIGDAIYGYEDLMFPIAVMREKSNEWDFELF